MTAMKALTVYQPYASLLVKLGAKPFEFRSWKPPANLLDPKSDMLECVLHSSQFCDWDAVYSLHGTLGKGSAFGIDRELGYELLDGPVKAIAAGEKSKAIDLLPVGVGLGVMTFGPFRRVADLHVPGISFAGIDESLYGWRVNGFIPFPEPIQARGQRKLWDWAALRPPQRGEPDPKAK